ncbi:MAG: YkgJ family cysteine cluster protein [Parachlamydiales bacterium]|nr:YkgJ family cysteine cluster protein [Parachlamydiales bacterium]
MDENTRGGISMEEVVAAPWFDDGLRFKCTGCGKCCTGSPGYVFLSRPDIERLAAHFSMKEEEFMRQKVRYVDEHYALLDKPGSGDCIFLENNKCSVYEARPVQCRTFPWWIQNLRDEKDWEEAGKRCEGINHPDAPLVSSLHIQQECLTYLDNLIQQNFWL